MRIAAAIALALLAGCVAFPPPGYGHGGFDPHWHHGGPDHGGYGRR